MGAPLSPWGASRRVPGGPWGGGPGPMSEAQNVASPLGFRIKINVDVDVDFGSFRGRSWVYLGGHVGVILALLSVQVGSKTVFEPFYLRKNDFSRNNTFSNGV